MNTTRFASHRVSTRVALVFRCIEPTPRIVPVARSPLAAAAFRSPTRPRTRRVKVVFVFVENGGERVSVRERGAPLLLPERVAVRRQKLLPGSDVARGDDEQPRRPAGRVVSRLHETNVRRRDESFFFRRRRARRRDDGIVDEPRIVGQLRIERADHQRTGDARERSLAQDGVRSVRGARGERAREGSLERVEGDERAGVFRNRLAGGPIARREEAEAAAEGDARVVTRDGANDRAGGGGGAGGGACGVIARGDGGEGDARRVGTRVVVASCRHHGRGGRVGVGGCDRGGGSEERGGDGGIAAAVVEVERAVDVEGGVAEGGDATREVSERSGRVRAECSAVVGMGERVPAPRRRVRGRRHGRVALAHHHVEEGEHRVESLALVRSLGRVPDPLLHQERADGGDPLRERLEVQAFSAGEHRRRETTRHDRSRRIGRRATGGVHRDRARGLDRHRVWRQAHRSRSWVTASREASRGPPTTTSDRPRRQTPLKSNATG